MNNRRKLTQREFDELLSEVVLNQAIEGYPLTAEEIATVRANLIAEHLPRRSWSPSWDVSAAIAVLLWRPDLLLEGRSIWLFVQGILAEAGRDTGAAWMLVETAFREGRRWHVRGLLEMIEGGVPVVERTDPIRFAALETGVAAARSAGWTERLRRLLGDG